MSEAPPNPMRAAQTNMRQPVVRRFYKTVEVRKAEGDRHLLTLDGRGARTPDRNPLAASSGALMLRVAEEWERQGDALDPADMPITRLLNAAIDGVSRTMDETRADILRYAGSDLLCYRAEEPDALVALQARAFDPVLRWAAGTLGARLRVVAGVIHVDQPAEALAAIRGALETFDEPAPLAALSAMTTLSGSALLALAAARGFLDPADAWRAAHVDEDYQNERWGVDEEEKVRREARRREFEAAATVLAVAGGA